MLEDLMNEIYGESCYQEETETEKKERQEQETKEVLQMLQAMGESKK